MKQQSDNDPDKHTDTLPPEGHVTLHVAPEPPGVPPPLPELPEPTNSVLRVDKPSTTPKVHNNKYGKKTVQWAKSGMRTVRTILEICTWTMLISTVALEKDPQHWKVLTPVSIEHGFDVLTPDGRKRGEEYMYKHKPDLIVGEWMCSPYSSMQHINMAKSPELHNKILQEQREHAKV